MKRDILAAIVFLVTGVLFWIAQTGAAGSAQLTCSEGCSAEQTVSVVESAGPAILHQASEVEKGWDS